MNIIKRWIGKKAISFLINSSPQKLVRLGEDKLIPTFRDAAKNVTAYEKILKKSGVDPKDVKDLESFKRLVPVIDKGIFGRYELSDFCRSRSMRDIKIAFTSSGASGSMFSYGVTSQRALNDGKFMVDVLLDYAFNTSKKKTFWIIAQSMGVRVFTDLPCAEVSVRPDMALALIKKFSSFFEQIIITGDVYYIKRLLEEGIERGINWKAMTVNITIGGDWFPEGYRDYLAHLLGIDIDSGKGGKILSTFGISELATTLFQESPDIIRIKRLAIANKEFRYALFGEGVDVCPALFHCHPYQMFVEIINGEIVFTMLESGRIIPLIRYTPRDKGRLYSYNEVKKILKKFNREDLAPELKLPMIAIFGRTDKFIDINGYISTPEQVKSGIYSSFDTAWATTGNFKMSAYERHLKIEIQLREKIYSSQELKEKFFEAISQYIKTDFELVIYPYLQFPYGIALDYEQKFKYI